MLAATTNVGKHKEGGNIQEFRGLLLSQSDQFSLINLDIIG